MKILEWLLRLWPASNPKKLQLPEFAHRARGGAWKVAYADFVTAMMALFMVLWICAQDEEILKATARYFQSPFSYPLQNAAYGIMDDGAASFENNQAESKSLVNMAFLQKLAQEFMRLLNIDENVSDRPVDIQITSDGLRIVLYNQSRQPFFEPMSATLTSWGDFTLQNLSWIIDRYNMKIRVDAFVHQITADERYLSEDYDPFDLTAHRANTVQKTLRHYGLTQPIDRVTAFGDKHPLPKQLPTALKNQRIEISLAPIS